jgi:hypothetical protein
MPPREMHRQPLVAEHLYDHETTTSQNLIPIGYVYDNHDPERPYDRTGKTVGRRR